LLRIRSLAACGAAVIVTAGLGFAPQAASAVASSGSSVVSDSVYQNQQELQQLKTWITSHSAWQAAGYVDQIDDPTTDSTTLLWSGSSPLRAAALNEAKRLGVTATVQNRPQTLPEVQATERSIADESPQLAAAGFTLTKVIGIQADMTKVTAVGTLASATAGTSTLHSLATQTVPAAVTSILGSDVAVQLAPSTFEVGEGKSAGTESTAADDAKTSTRQDVQPPAAAGAFMTSTGGNCTTGLALKVNGVAYATTDRHCIADETGWSPYGGSADESGSLGTSQIVSEQGGVTVLTSSGAPQVFDGDWDNSVGYEKDVVGTFQPSIGDYLCTSGGNSGEHCDVVVNSVADQVNDGSGLIYVDGADQIDSGAYAMATGDSGGAVITLTGTSNTATQVQAVGWEQGIDSSDDVDCGHIAESLGTNCSTQMFFSTLTVVLESSNLNGTGVTTQLDTAGN
jgi:hypothetical protein